MRVSVASMTIFQVKIAKNNLYGMMSSDNIAAPGRIYDSHIVELVGNTNKDTEVEQALYADR
jgi:hypothetical protein